jgi:hypothetical protein
LMLLFRILNAVLTSNRPPPPPRAAMSVDRDGAPSGVAVVDAAYSAGDEDKWTKSSALRARLGEMVVSSLLRSLAKKTTSAATATGRDGDDEEGDETTTMMRVACRDEVHSALDEWGECDAFGGPTVWEEYRRGWTAALREAAAASAADEVDGVNHRFESTTTTTTTDVDARSEKAMAPTTSTDGDDSIGGTSHHAGGQESGSGGDGGGPSDVNGRDRVVIENQDEPGETDDVVGDTSSSTPLVEEIGNEKTVQASTKDGVASVDVEIDFEVRIRL